MELQDELDRIDRELDNNCNTKRKNGNCLTKNTCNKDCGDCEIEYLKNELAKLRLKNA